jgi:hypothetical protein
LLSFVTFVGVQKDHDNGVPLLDVEVAIVKGYRYPIEGGLA